MFAENLTGRAMRGLIAIERDLMRQSPLAPESPSEEHLGRGDVSVGAKQNIDGLSRMGRSEFRCRVPGPDARQWKTWWCVR
jgi:hypothetical protein